MNGASRASKEQAAAGLWSRGFRMLNQAETWMGSWEEEPDIVYAVFLQGIQLILQAAVLRMGMEPRSHWPSELLAQLEEIQPTPPLLKDLIWTLEANNGSPHGSMYIHWLRTAASLRVFVEVFRKND